MTDRDLIYYTVAFVFCILGLAWHPFFFSFMLSFPIIQSDTLLSVLEALWSPRRQIALTTFLLAITIYLLSIVTFWWFSDAYPNGTCDDLWLCFIINVD